LNARTRSDEAEVEDLDDFVEGDAAMDRLREANARLARQVNKFKTEREDLVEAVYRAARDGIAALDIPPVPRPDRDGRKRLAEVAVIGLADWQLGKVTPDYNSDVCEQRIELFADKVIKLTDIQRADHPVKEAEIWAVGDIIEGEEIFPGQPHLIDSGLYRQILVNGNRIAGNFTRRMLSHFDRVTFYGVIGNHGKIGGRAYKQMDPETNGDRMLYRTLQMVLEATGEKRVSWVIPDGPRERNWYAVSDIGGYRTLLFHGDQMRGHSGLPWYGFYKKLLGWKVGAIPGGFDDAFAGHWHTPTTMTFNTIRCRVSGSPESMNTYAQEQLSAVGRPSQHLMFVKPGVGPTAEYTVWLDGQDAAQSSSARLAA
jgi:hypothetical protein